MEKRAQYGRMIRVELTGLAIEDLRIAFESKSVADANEQDSKITLYNLKESSYQQIYDNYKNDGHRLVRVYAGYRENIGRVNVLSGVIAWITREARDGSIMTIIHVGDRIKDSGNNIINQTWEDGTSAEVIIRDIAATMGLGVANTGVLPKGIINKSITMQGLAANELRDYTASLRKFAPDLYFYSDGKNIVLARGGVPREDSGLLVKSPGTGLIGVPRLEEDGRLTVETLLDPRMQLKAKIKFKYSKYIDEEEDYTIDAITHSGDNWTGRFVSKVECIPKDYQPLSSSGRRPDGPKTAFGQSPASRAGESGAPERATPGTGRG